MTSKTKHILSFSPKTLNIRNTIGTFLFCCLFGFQVQAQDIPIQGTVFDEYGDPVIGASVVLKEDMGIGTVTDLDGMFKMAVPSERSVLLFQYIGYTKQEIKVGTQRIFTVNMKPNIEQLSEVQITALGIKRQKREIGYSTENFDGEQLEKSNASNVVSALSGRSAGVQIATPNGVDGGTTRITIRGNNNLSGDNQPLIIVDGVPLQNDPGLENIGRGTDWGSAINNINPLDIESMDVLKGPTASALYGSRGANGVIIITTKRGTKRKGIGVDYSIQHKIIQPYRYRDVQNVYGAGGPSTFLEPTFSQGEDELPKHLTEDGFFPEQDPFTSENFGFYGTGVSWGPKMEGQMIEWWDGEIRPYDPQPDNLKQFYSNGQTTTHNLSFSGGGEMGTMRVSLTRSDHTAVVPNSGYDQTTVNVGSSLNISSKLKADVSINYINYNRLNSPALGDDHDNSFAKGVLYSFPRSYKGLEKDLYALPDGSRNDYGGRFPYLYSGRNIWWNTYNNNTTLGRDKLLGAISLTYDINSWLNFTGRLGMDFTLNQFEKRNNPINPLGILEASYSNELTRDVVNNNEVLLTAYKDGFLSEDLNVRFAVGGSQWGRSQYGLKGSSNNWVNPWLFSFDNEVSLGRLIEDIEDLSPSELAEQLNQLEAEELAELLNSQLPQEFRYEKRINSVFSFINFGYKNYVFLELTGRKDWSSALPIDNNDYFYPSASLSFIPTEMFDFGWEGLSFLKLRAAYAETATDTNPFQLDRVYDIGNFGGTQTSSAEGTINPLELRPQLAKSYEAGFTMGLFSDKINLDFTYYKINSFDQILDAPLPASSGANFITINTGELQNQGLEAILNLKIIENRNFFLETSFNIARNRNKVVSLGDSGAEILELADIWELNGPAIAARTGDDFGTIVGYDYIYHENGQPILNDEGTHYLFTDTRVPVGNASPSFTGGWSMRMGGKGLSLSTLVDTKWGGDIYSGSYVTGLQNGQSPTTLVEREGGGLPYTDPSGETRNVGVVLDGVYADGTPNDKVVHYYYKYIPNTGGWGKWLTTPGVIENSWIKLREVALTYEFNEVFTSKSKVFEKLSVSLVARDVGYLYTSLPDRINPEGNNGAGNAQGLEWASLPGMRSFGFAVNASF